MQVYFLSASKQNAILAAAIFCRDVARGSLTTTPKRDSAVTPSECAASRVLSCAKVNLLETGPNGQGCARRLCERAFEFFRLPGVFFAGLVVFRLETLGDSQVKCE